MKTERGRRTVLDLLRLMRDCRLYSISFQQALTEARRAFNQETREAALKEQP